MLVQDVTRRPRQLMDEPSPYRNESNSERPTAWLCLVL